LIVLAGVGAYHNSFRGVFVLDDEAHIRNNKRIREFWPLSQTLSGRRPVVDLTLALNYGFGKLEIGGRPIGPLSPWHYHAVNLCIHILAGLTLFGALRRTIMRVAGAGVLQRSAAWLALVAALIWIVHPLQTQSVTYVVQRGESLMGLFYLLTLYSVLRGVERAEGGSGRRAVLWFSAAVLSCALGMGSKGVMVTAPFVIALYDWVFLSESLGHLIRRRWGLYVALLATWVVLILTGVGGGVLDASNQRATVGFGYRGISPGAYLLTQVGVLAYYVKLSLWPANLCLDYAWPVAQNVREILLPAIVVVPLLVGTLWALIRRSWIGFAGAWFFLILAPTSSIVPIKDPMFEHRMYLPLAGVIALVVLGAYALGSWWARGKGRTAGSWARWSALVASVAIVALAMGATIRRNRDYHDELIMWRDVLAKRPDHPRGYLGFGTALFERGAHQEAEQAFRRAVALNPSYADAYYNLGNTVRELGRPKEAVDAYRRCLRLNQRHDRAWYNLANTLKQLEEYDAAIEAYRRAVDVKPSHISAWINLGNTLTLLGRLDEAVDAYKRAIALNPRYANARLNYGRTLRLQGKLDEALEQLRLASEFAPTDPRYREAYESLRAGMERSRTH
jgi:tetratricopeptide (TPR) repeat protein